MKKITSLQIMMLMGLALGSSFSFDLCAKESSTTIKKDVANKDSMKQIEKDLRKVQKDFKKSKNRSKALHQLKEIEARIKAFVKHLKASEKHGSMWEVHEHTLQRKLREVRDFVNKINQ